VWDLVRGLVSDGTTVLLTTQYLDEADRLATEVAVIDHGRVIEHGTPADLKAKVGGQTLDVRPADRTRIDATATILAEVAGATPVMDAEGGLLSAPVERASTGTVALAELARRLDGAGIAATELGLRLASLDEVFLALTGRGTKSDAGGKNEEEL
jgi:oleandomycin transport system ATP-binding protein